MKTLTKEDQITILKGCKERLKKRLDGSNGVCCAIAYEIMPFGIDIGANGSKRYFDLLTIENATIACREKHVTLPNINDIGYWWRHGNFKSRIVFINWMIEQLQKDIENVKL